MAKLKKPARKTKKAKKAKPARRKPARGKAPVRVKPRAVKKLPRPARKQAPAVGGLPQKLYEAALKVLEDRQAEDIVSVNLAGRSSVADYLIIASGRAQRQIAAIAQYLREAFAALGVRQTKVEGLPEANWVLVDAGDVVIHLFRPDVRRYYGIEDIWNARDEEQDEEEEDIEKAGLLIE